MLTDIYSATQHITVGPTGPNTGYFGTQLPDRAHAGDVIYDGTISTMKVYDGANWQSLDACTSIDMDPEAEMALEWAKKRMRQEKEWDEMSATNVAVEKALEQYRKAEEQLRVVVALSQKTPEPEHDDDIPF